MLYESAARAEEILTVDIGDLDLDDKWVRIRAKGGAIEYVYWQTATARLLPRLIDGRGAAPLFLADRQPAPAPRPATRRHLPGHRAGSALLPARGVLVQAGRPPRSRPRADPAGRCTGSVTAP